MTDHAFRRADLGAIGAVRRRRAAMARAAAPLPAGSGLAAAAVASSALWAGLIWLALRLVA